KEAIEARGLGLLLSFFFLGVSLSVFPVFFFSLLRSRTAGPKPQVGSCLGARCSAAKERKKENRKD
ncbi:MAG: hypothetical protein ACT6SG_20475, partial [Hydrogenophaga sp.]|uniref:hypothetical protein n=1 Tax=Hydrogenophaga sp. TaxID=1904254 RepID=UPI004035823D